MIPPKEIFSVIDTLSELVTAVTDENEAGEISLELFGRVNVQRYVLPPAFEVKRLDDITIQVKRNGECYVVRPSKKDRRIQFLYDLFSAMVSE